MNQEEFRELFIVNHNQIVNDICHFLEVDLDTVNHMLKKSYIAIAGGYARRLYMVQNKIDFDVKDMEAYHTSDVDFFVLSGVLKDNKEASSHNDVFNDFVSSSPSPSFHHVITEYVDEVTMSLYTGSTTPTDTPSQQHQTELRFKPLKNLLRKSEHISQYDRRYMFYKDSLLMTTCFRGISVFNIKNVSMLGKDMPNIQFVKVSKHKLRDYAIKNNIPQRGAYAFTKILTGTFDLSQTKFYIKTLDHDISKCLIDTQQTNTNVYDCDLSEHMFNNVNMFIRIKKYASIGMRFSKEQISKLVEPNNKRNLSTGVIEGGYY